ncbi:MAG: restriction endonuclease subunit S [Candidatus Binatia bacterium]
MKTWQMKNIFEVYDGLFDGPHATPRPCDEGPIFLGIENLTESGLLDLSQTKKISHEEFPRWTRRVLPKAKDIVFSYEATLNRYAIIPRGFRGCLGRRLALIRPNENKVSHKFLLYYFLSSAWRAEVNNYLISGSTVDRIPLLKFPKFKIYVPPVTTQRKIAAILSAYDELIENNKRRIALLETMAEEIYREWFVRLRFPGHEKVKVVKGVPEGWEVRPFSEIVNINPSEWVDRSEEIPFVGMEDLSVSSMYFTPKESRKGGSGSKFRNHDVLFPRITPSVENGKRGFVMTLADGQVGFGSTEFIVMRKRIIGPEHIYFLTCSSDFRKHAELSMTGASGRQRVQEECFSFFLVKTPPSEIRQKFSEIVRPHFSQIHLLSCQTDLLMRSRDLLLPRLISGKLSVENFDIQFPPSMGEETGDS